VRIPWGAAAALALPAFALAMAAGAVGITRPVGAALAGAAVLWLIVDLVVFQPRLLPARTPDDVARDFLEKALACRRIQDVALELGRAVGSALGRHGVEPRTILFVPDATGAVQAMLAAGVAPQADPLGSPELAIAAFQWLGEIDSPVHRTDLVPLVEQEGGDVVRPVLALLERAGCDFALPLRHRGLLLGVVMIGDPPAGTDIAGTQRFLRALRAYTTAAVARTFLGAEARTRSHLAKSFDLATATQEAMMPEERPVRRTNWTLRGLYRPVAECGGDLWVWRDLGDDRVLLLVADATGHGAAPALLAAVAKGTIDARWQLATAHGNGDLDPSELLAELNRAVHRAGRKRYFMTAFAAVVDGRAGRLRYANAGQNFPYLVGAPRGGSTAPVVEPLIARGDTLGSSPETRYQTLERAIVPGDRLVLYTDGVVDAGTPFRDPFGDKRLRAVLVTLASERATRLPDLVMAEIERHTGGQALADDVTLLAYELGPDDHTTSGTHATATRGGGA
jgi:sigma-B regulation protein RsbU (phosphoserine phosphatase)